MNKHFVLSAIAVFLLFYACQDLSAENEPRETYSAAISAYENGDYQSSITMLSKLIDDLKLNTIETIIQAHTILGASYLFMENDEKAKKHFETIINFDSHHELDKNYYPPKVVVRFEEIKKAKHLHQKTYAPNFDIAPKNEIEHSSPKPKDVSKHSSIQAEQIFDEQKKFTDENTRNPFANSFVPFGVGQLKNNSPTKGYIFMTTQIFTVLATITPISAYYAVRNPDGTFDDRSLARGLKAGFYTSLTFYICSTIVGIVDATVNHKEYPYADKKNETISLMLEPSERGVIVNGVFVFRIEI